MAFESAVSISHFPPNLSAPPAQVADLIKAANAASNPLEALPSFQAYHRNGLSCSVRYFTPATLPPALLDWCFALVKSNMEELYKPVWGWSDRKKRSELADEASRFIIAFEEGDEARPVAFVNARCGCSSRRGGRTVFTCCSADMQVAGSRRQAGGSPEVVVFAGRMMHSITAAACLIIGCFPAWIWHGHHYDPANGR